MNRGGAGGVDRFESGDWAEMIGCSDGRVRGGWWARKCSGSLAVISTTNSTAFSRLGSELVAISQQQAWVSCGGGAGWVEQAWLEEAGTWQVQMSIPAAWQEEQGSSQALAWAQKARTSSRLRNGRVFCLIDKKGVISLF